MDKELQLLLDQARSMGASREQLDDILARYNSKKKEQPEEPFRFGVSDTPSAVPSQEIPEVKQQKKSFLEYISERPILGSGPTDLRETAVLRDQPSLIEVLKENPEYGNKMVNRSVAAAKTGILLAESDAGMRSVDFEELASIQKIIQENQPEEGDLFYNKEDGFVGFMYDLARTLPESFISMGAAAETPLTAGAIAAGAGVGTVVPGVGTAVGASSGFAFATSAINEYGTTIMAMLDEEGVDVTNAQELRSAFADEELIGRIKKRAGARSGVIGLIDGISGGVAGKLSKKIVGEVGEEVVENLAKGTAKEIIDGAKSAGRKITYGEIVETSLESLAGGAGEALGSLAAGQEVSMRDVLLETLADPTSKIISIGGSKAQSLIDGVSKNLEGSGNITDSQKELLNVAKNDPQRFQDIIAASQYRNSGEIKAINAKIAAIKESSAFGEDKSLDRLIGNLQRRKANLQLQTLNELSGASQEQLTELSTIANDIEALNAKYSDGSLTGDALSAVKEGISDKLDEFNTKYSELSKTAKPETVKEEPAPKPTEEVEIDRTVFSEEDLKAIDDLNKELVTAVREKDTKKQQEIATAIIDIENKYRDSQKEAGVPSPKQEGQAPIQEQPVKEGGVETPETGRMVQELEEVTDAESFSKAIDDARDELSKDERRLDLQVSPVEPKAAKKIVSEGGKIFMSPDRMAGGFVESDGYIGGIFKDPRSKAKNVAKNLIKRALDNGGKYLDAYATKLEDIYIDLGFRPVARVPFSEEFAPDGWDAPKSVLKGKPDVVFFVYDPKNAKGTKGQGEVITDYDAAKKMAKDMASQLATPETATVAQKLKTADQSVNKFGDTFAPVVENFGKLINKLGGENVPVYVVDGATYKETTGRESRGSFTTVDGKKAILVNADKATLGTVYHEMMHAYISSMKMSPKQIVDFANTLKAELKKGNAKEKQLAAQLDAFQKEYIKREVYGKGLTMDDPNIAEEFLSEFVGQIKDGIDINNMSLSTIDKIRLAVANFINRILNTNIDTAPIESRQEAFDFIENFLSALEGRTEITKKPEAKKADKGEEKSREQIDAVKIISSETPKQKAKKEAVAEILNGFAESQLEPNSPEQDLVSRFLNNIFEESLYTLKKGPRESGMTWYIEDITEFENKMTVLLPELADPNQMKLFKQVLAITSSGTNPNQNLQTAYTLWVRSNGSAVNFAKNWGQDKISFITKKGEAIGTGIIVRETKTKYVVQKVDALGKPETFSDGTPKLFEAKKSEMKDGYPKPAGFTARGNIVAQQLSKIEQVYKSVGNDINKLIEFFENPQPVSELRKYNKGVPDINGKNQKVAVGKRNGAFIFGEKIGAFYQNMIGIGDTITMDLWWSRTWNRYMGTMLSTVDGKQVIQETPRTDRERDVMRKAVTLAANKLGLDVSELQAVIWYFEQELWTKAGNVSPSFSYVTAVDALNSKIETDEQTQKRFSEAGADLTAAEKRRQDAITRANNIIADGGIQGDVAKQQIDWQPNLLGKGKANPAIVNRTTPVQEAALELLQGKITNAEYQEIVRTTQPIEPITKFFLPASTKDMQDALDSNKAKLLNTPLEDGEAVGLRLDIPAYKNWDIWIVSIHDSGKAGKSLSYGSVAWATDVTFGSNPKVAAFIAAGKNLDLSGKLIAKPKQADGKTTYDIVDTTSNKVIANKATIDSANKFINDRQKQDKTTIARMHGKWKNFEGKTKEERDASAVKKVEEIVAIENSFPGADRKGSPWRQIGMNPFRHSWFYDRRTGQPVIAASEVVQIGGLVYAKDVLYADKNDMAFEVSGYKDANGDPVRFQLELDDMKIMPSVYKKNIFQKLASQFTWTAVEKQARILFESKESQVTIAVREARDIANKIRRLANTTEMLDMVSNYMEGNNRRDIAQELSKTAKGQKLLDLLQDADAMVEGFAENIVDDPAFDTLPIELKFAITNNAGTYLKTRYRFFTDKNYKIKDKQRAKAIQAERDMIVAREMAVMKKAGLSEDEINEAIQNSLKDIDKRAHESIDLYINKIENVRSAPSITGSDIKIPSSSFQFKKDLPYYIQELLGIDKDPVSRFSATVQAQANILYKGRMVQGLLDMSKGMWDEFILDNKPEPAQVPFYKEVKDPYSPMNGKWVHSEIMGVFERKPLYQSDNAWFQGYFSLLKLGRKSKVIWNIPTWRKNLTGGWYFMVANGVLANPRAAKDIKDRLTLTINSDKIMTDPQTKEWIKIMGKKGLIGTNVDAQLIGINDAAYSYMYDGDEKAYTIAYKKLVSKLSNADKWLQEKYSSVDDYTKLVIFRSEVDSFAKKIYGKEYESLTEPQKDRVHDEAAEFVKQNTPTFSRLPKFYDKLAVVPIFGDFASFQFESIRSMSSNIINGVSDMKTAIEGIDKDGNKLNEEQKKAYRNSAAKRLVGTLSVFALKYAMVTGLQQLFLDEEDEEIADDAKRVTPEWMKGQSLIVKSIDKNGDVRVYNYSSEDPYGTLGDLVTPTGWTALYETFVRPNIAIDYIVRAVEGEDIYGRKIFDKSDTTTDNALNFLGYTAKTFVVPPFISSSYRDVVRQQEKGSKNLFADPEQLGDLAKTIGERSIVRDYKYNILDQFRYSVKDMANQKPLKEAGDKDKRYRHLDSIREDYKSIVRISAAKENYQMANDAKKMIKRYFEKEEELYILNGIKMRD